MRAFSLLSLYTASKLGCYNPLKGYCRTACRAERKGFASRQIQPLSLGKSRALIQEAVNIG